VLLLLLQASRLDQVAGLLVDLKLLQLDCLEALAAQLGGNAAQPATAGRAAATGASSSSSGSSAGGADEVSQLLGEAEQLAAELYGE
jgi:hypothetical protein